MVEFARKNVSDPMKHLEPGRLIPGLAAALAIAIGGISLAAWGVGRWDWLTLGESYVPVAPVTAMVFLLLGGSLALRVWFADRAFLMGLVRVGLGLSTLFAGTELVRTRWPMVPPWDRWGSAVELGYGAIQIRMAPMTAAVCILTAGAMIGTCPNFSLPKWTQLVARFAGAGGILLSGLVILAYAAGTPLGYANGQVPMAWLTALGFLSLCGGGSGGGPR